MSIERERALALQRRALRDWVAFLGAASPGAFIEESAGVAAAVVPAVPERSIANSVTYEDAGALAAGLERLAGVYDAAGVNAWTVWAPEFDREAIAALEGTGHKLDGKPVAMVLELEQLRTPGLDGLDYDPECSMETFGRLNEAAYEHGSGYAAMLATRPDGPDLRIYGARAGGETASVLATIDHEPVAGADGPDCGIYWVATAAAARGRGLATRLLGAALGEARGRGCATSTLQASAMGEPVYLALGYEPAFRLHMYERRRPA